MNKVWTGRAKGRLTQHSWRQWCCPDTHDRRRCRSHRCQRGRYTHTADSWGSSRSPADTPHTAGRRCWDGTCTGLGGRERGSAKVTFIHTLNTHLREGRTTFPNLLATECHLCYTLLIKFSRLKLNPNNHTKTENLSGYLITVLREIQQWQPGL